MENNLSLAVVGSRSFDDYKLFTTALTDFLKRNQMFTSLISGGAIGTDKMAEKYAREFALPIKIITPEWEEYGKKAGYIRNRKIWECADAGVAFWDGQSKGTAHSFQIAKTMKKQLFVFNTRNQHWNII